MPDRDDVSSDDISMITEDGEAEDCVAIPLEMSAEDFYNQNDSAYIRIRYFPEVDGYKFEVWNEYLSSFPDNAIVPPGGMMLGTLARGVVHVLLNAPGELYRIGQQAEMRDFIHNSEELSDEQKALFGTEIKGTA